ncbi:MAG: NUDIX hydrolase [Lachnospiraceae bacterium]|nr:NUDIX hydrolase [Lachnospiraceae bacterium]
MADKVERVDRKLVYQGHIFDVYTDYVKVHEDRIAEWDFIKHKGAAAAVAVLDDGRLLMVKQYRNALDRYTIEIPAGARDSEEEPTEICAARELEEETGYRSEHLEFLIRLRTTVAFCDELIDVYVAKDLIPSKQHLDEDESIDLEAFTVEELCEKIYQGEIQDSKTVASILAYKDKYLK